MSQKGIIFLAIICIFGFFSYVKAVAQIKNGGDIQFEAKTSKLGPVIFSHDTHIMKNKFKCTDCHVKIFKMKKGEDKMTQALFAKGKFCGACHDSKKSFSATNPRECIKCHKLPSGNSPAPTPVSLPSPVPASSPSASGTKTAESATAVSKAGSANDDCLECHGPFDKRISATADYIMMPSRVKASPHRYVPHKSKNIPDCANCHKPHSLPLISAEGLPKGSADWCYTCHHQGLLECGTCHTIPRNDKGEVYGPDEKKGED